MGRLGAEQLGPWGSLGLKGVGAEPGDPKEGARKRREAVTQDREGGRWHRQRWCVSVSFPGSPRPALPSQPPAIFLLKFALLGAASLQMVF